MHYDYRHVTVVVLHVLYIYLFLFIKNWHVTIAIINNCGKIKRNTYINNLSVIIIVVVVVMVNVNSARGSSVVVVRCT